MFPCLFWFGKQDLSSFTIQGKQLKLVSMGPNYYFSLDFFFPFVFPGCEPAVCSRGQEGQWYPRVQVKGGDPLLCPGEDTSGVLYPVLGSPDEKRQEPPWSPAEREPQRC